MSEKINHILIVGAARSGTHLLATMLRARVDCAYAGEVNDVWRLAAGNCRHDMIPASSATTNNCRAIHRYFDQIRREQNKAVILEKTAANSLRMPFVYRVYPNATIIHIIRDGRDVAISARRKYQGDTRKITRNSNQTPQSNVQRLQFLTTVVRHKFSSGLSPTMLLRNMGRYSTSAISAMGLKQEGMWGPRFPGMKELFASHSLLEVAGLQWRFSMENMAGFIETNKPKRLFELKFEDLTSHPEKKLEEILDFLGNDVPRLEVGESSKIIPATSTWRDVLQEDESSSLNELILSTLKRYDYA